MSQPFTPTAPPTNPPSTTSPRKAPLSANTSTSGTDTSDIDTTEAPTKAFLPPKPTPHPQSRNSNHHPETLYEKHTLAPSPSQTYYQLMVLDDGHVVIRDWPRKRLSTKWTRDGNINPGEHVITYTEVHEWEGNLRSVFGDEVWKEVTKLCKDQTKGGK